MERETKKEKIDNMKAADKKFKDESNYAFD
jgi:hypothetical protein